MKRFVSLFRTASAFLAVCLILCGCFGAFLYLERTAVQEPLLSVEREGNFLMVQLSKQKYTLSLAVPEKIWKIVQHYWILLPPKWRLQTQGFHWLWQQKDYFFLG